MILGEEILEAMGGCIKIKTSEDQLIEVDIEEIIKVIIMREVGVRLGNGHTQAMFEEMTEVIVIVGQGQDQEQVLLEIELGVISAKNMII